MTSMLVGSTKACFFAWIYLKLSKVAICEGGDVHRQAVCSSAHTAHVCATTTYTQQSDAPARWDECMRGVQVKGAHPWLTLPTQPLVHSEQIDPMNTCTTTWTLAQPRKV